MYFYFNTNHLRKQREILNQNSDVTKQMNYLYIYSYCFTSVKPDRLKEIKHSVLKMVRRILASPQKCIQG